MWPAVFWATQFLAFVALPVAQSFDETFEFSTCRRVWLAIRENLILYAVLGGIGSLPGAMLGGVLLGLIEAMWSAYFSAEYKDVAAFGVLVFGTLQGIVAAIVLSLAKKQATALKPQAGAASAASAALPTPQAVGQAGGVGEGGGSGGGGGRQWVMGAVLYCTVSPAQS